MVRTGPLARTAPSHNRTPQVVRKGPAAGRFRYRSGPVNPYVSNTTWADIALRIDAAARIALITHNKPDGDGLGSLLALARTLPDLGKQADIFLMGPIERPLRPIAGETPYRLVERDHPTDDYDLIIVADTSAWSQLEPLADWLRKHRERIITIDHHSRGDEVGSLRIVEPRAAATAQMIVSLFDEAGWEIKGGLGSAAEAIYVGIATDTGWFRYDNAGPETFRVAARLLECGVDKSRLYRLIEETHRPQRLLLEARALNSVEYACDGTVAIQYLRPEDFEQTGGRIEDLTGMVNLPMIVEQVRVSILLSESEPGRTKLSFRAKPPLPGETPVDVNKLAQHFGGGGHVFAAGARIDASLDEARQQLLKVLEPAR